MYYAMIWYYILEICYSLRKLYKKMTPETNKASLKEFPWKEVTFELRADGEFETTQAVHKAWQKYGFFVLKNCFTKRTMEALDTAIKAPIIQV